jgi:hypothetical protein
MSDDLSVDIASMNAEEVSTWALSLEDRAKSIEEEYRRDVENLRRDLLQVTGTRDRDIGCLRDRNGRLEREISDKNQRIVDLQSELRSARERMQVALNERSKSEERAIQHQMMVDTWKAYCNRMLATIRGEGS